MIDVGCGYGTFTIPAARLIKGNVIGIDIDEDILKACKNKGSELGIENLKLLKRDIFEEGYGMEEETVSDAFLFNILHCEEPLKLLTDTYKVLSSKGKLYVIHWIYDKATPRGPSLEIRPKPDQIIKWAEEVGFQLIKQIEIPKYHFCLTFKK